MSNSDHKLSPCPSSPNCVSSLSTDPKHSIEALRHSGSQDEARRRILAVLDSQERARVTQTDDNYIHAEFRSLIFKFVDDVEFYFPEEDDIIHVRSASRVGYADFGANRKRVEQIRRDFEGTPHKPELNS